MDDIHKNIEEHNPIKKRKILIVSDDVITDMLSNAKNNSIVTELLIRGRKPNISLVFIIQSFFAVPRNIRLNCTHHFIMKISNKRDLQQIAFNHSSYIDLEFVNLYKKCTAKIYSFLVIDTSLASDNPLRFRVYFLNNMLNYLINNKLKEIMKFQDIIKTDDLHYKSGHQKNYNFTKYSLPIVF